jgi:leucyl aminopeptidase
MLVDRSSVPCEPRRACGRICRRADIVPRTVQVSATTQPASATDADTVVVGLFDSEPPSAAVPAEVGKLVESGEAKGSFKALALTHAEGKRWLTVGLGGRKDFTPEHARVAAAVARERAPELATSPLCWQAPIACDGDAKGTTEIVEALVEGTILADYRFDLYKSKPAGGEETPNEDKTPKHLEQLLVAVPADGGLSDEQAEAAAVRATIVAEAVNKARDLQNRPGNDLTPTALAEYALALGEEIEALQVEVQGRSGIEGLGMGAFAAVAQGSEQDPALIVLKYEGPAEISGPTLGFVGKAVTFDSGGISLKPGAKMAEMKFDMSGGAAVVEAVAAIARLQLPVRLVAVVGATENLPSHRAVKPGDIVTAKNGKTIEVNNTDAEGRLVLADCLCHAISLGAERIVDLATLTGAVIVALGSTYAGLMSNDDELTERVTAAGARTGEIVWRLPLHAEYSELIAGKYGDLDNAPEARKAGTITAASFLSNFVGETPWVHLDIAGSAWDLGRAYVGKGASGYGVRLLVELARSYSA